MATLVLTAVGGAIGGPIGAALGGLIGQAVDRDVLFRPKGRQGPRLTELAVQTSSYGTQLPQVFGAMRVAGCVIWSTDLIESKATSSAGKGQPKTTSYSYSASFAVTLSARRVMRIGRVWADGNLLRGAAGDFKSEQGAFRWYPGDEEQLVDPLIASAEGTASTPAHRGLSYAVFEQLQLADFGNRIPSLTFEVIADDATTVGGIARDIAAPAIVAASVAMPLAGFSAYGDSVRGVLETLAEASGAWFAPAGDGLTMIADTAATGTIADDGAAVEGAGARRTRTTAPIDGTAKTLALTHYDPARDYQIGLQRARRPGAGDRAERVELPAAIDAGSAKTIAAAMLARADAGRVRRTVACGLEAMAVAPGDVVAIAGESGSWRVDEAALEAMVVTLTLVPLHPAPAAIGASAGRVLAASDLTAGRTVLHTFETPALDDQVLSAPRLTIAAAGTGAGWRRAALLVSTDDGATWSEGGQTAAPATLGVLVTPPGPASAALRDLAGSMVVELAHEAMTLADADDAALDSGANLALVGDELLQFGRAAPLGERRWRLTRLLRGRRGTEAAIGMAAAGDRFVVLSHQTAVTLDLPLATLGRSVRVMASGPGDGDTPVETVTVLNGVSVRPPSPVLLRAVPDGAGGVVVRWVRRSRAGWRWIDGADVPLAEELERYRVTVRDAAGGEREAIVTVSTVAIYPDERTRGSVTVTVRQSGTNGESVPATIVVG